MNTSRATDETPRRGRLQDDERTAVLICLKGNACPATAPALEWPVPSSCRGDSSGESQVTFLQETRRIGSRIVAPQSDSAPHRGHGAGNRAGFRRRARSFRWCFEGGVVLPRRPWPPISRRSLYGFHRRLKLRRKDTELGT